MLLTLSIAVFGTEPPLDLMPLIQEAGFRHLEVVDRGEYCGKEGVLDDLARRASDREVGLPNWHFIQESRFRETKQAMRATVDRMKESMDRGSRIGARNHVLHWYQRFLDRSQDALWREIVDEWVDHAASLRVRLLMETVPDKPSNERHVRSAEIIEFVCGYPADVLSVRVVADLAAFVRTETGVSVPVVESAATVTEDGLTLKPEYHQRHLILIGNALNNRAILPLYCRWLDAADGACPGDWRPPSSTGHPAPGRSPGSLPGALQARPHNSRSHASARPCCPLPWPGGRGPCHTSTQ